MKKTVRSLVLCLLFSLLFGVLCACVPSNDGTEHGTTGTEALTTEKNTEATTISQIQTDPDPETEGLDLVRMRVSYTDGNNAERLGDIVIKLCPDVAPLTVKNFKRLVSEGFYNGLTFHRIISGFMIQGGDPRGNGTGATGPIRGEFAANGIKNDLSHTRGVISMARRGNDYDSGSCQFFIVHETSARNTASLDGLYAAFGYVIEGIEHVDGIASTAVTPGNSRPIKNVTIVSATLEAEADKK